MQSLCSEVLDFSDVKALRQDILLPGLCRDWSRVRWWLCLVFVQGVGTDILEVRSELKKNEGLGITFQEGGPGAGHHMLWLWGGEPI